MAILTVGIDLAKNVFAVHGVNESGRSELVKPVVARDKPVELLAALPPCVVGMPSNVRIQPPPQAVGWNEGLAVSAAALGRPAQSAARVGKDAMRPEANGVRFHPTMTRVRKAASVKRNASISPLR